MNMMKSLAVALLGSALSLLSLSSASAQMTTWNDGDLANNAGSWSDDLNWNNASPATIGSGAVVHVGVLPAAGITVDTGLVSNVVASFTFDNTYNGSATVVQGGPEQLTVSGAITNNNTAVQNISLPVIATAATTIAGGTGGISFGSITINGNTIGTSGTITINGPLVSTITTSVSFGSIGSGAGSTLVFTNGSTLNISGSYTGTLGNSFQVLNAATITGATFSLAAGNLSLPTLSAGLVWNTSALDTTGVLTVSAPANQTLTGLTNVNPATATINIIAGTSTGIGASLNNTAGAGANALAVNLSGTAGTGGSITNFAPTTGTNVTANSSAAVTGTLNAGTAGLNQTYSVTNTDPNAITTTATASNTLNVYNKSSPSLSAPSASIGTVITGATVTAPTTNLQNAAGINAGLSVVSTGGLTNTGGSTLIAAGGSDTLTSPTVNTGTVGAYSQSYTIMTADDPSVINATADANKTFTVTGTVLAHSNGALTITGGNNQTVIVGATGVTAALSLTNVGANNASLLVNSLGAGVTGPLTAVAANGNQAYTGAINTSTIGANETNNYSINVQDAALPGQGAAYNVTTSATVTVEDHSSPSLNLPSADFGTVITGAAVANQTTNLQNAAGLRAGLQVVSTGGLINVGGMTLIPAGGSDALAATVSTGTVGAYSHSYTVQTEDDQSVAGATTNANQTFTVTGDVLAHSNGALNIVSGNNQTVIVGAVGVTADLSLTNVGANNASMLVNNVGAGLTGPNTTVAANGSNAYTAALNTATIGANESNNYTINVQDQALPGQGAAYNANATVNLNVEDHSAASLSTGSVNFGNAHQGGTVANATTNLQNAAGLRADLQVVSTGGLTPTNVPLIAPGGSATLTATVNTATAGAYSQNYTIQTEDDQSVAGANAGNPNLTFQVTGNIYTGQSVWNTNGGGTWGTLTPPPNGTNFGTNWGANQGSPGLDPNFVNTDTATFDNTALTAGNTATVTLDGAIPSLKSITFNTAGGGYTIAQGTGGSIKLNNGGSAATITDNSPAAAGSSQTISAPIELDSNGSATVTNAGNTLTLSGAISEAGGSKSLTLAGAGTTVLSGTNTYSGATNIQAGTTKLGRVNELSNSSNVALSGGTLDADGNNQTLTNFTGATGTTVTNSSGTVSQVQFVTPTNPVASNVNGNINLVQNQLGATLALTGTNNYSGGTTLSSGTIQAGSATALGAAAVTNNGTSLNNITTLEASATNHVINVGTSYTQGAFGNLQLTINSNPSADPGVTDTNDVLKVTTTAALNGSLTLSFVPSIGFTPTTGQVFTVVQAAGGITLTGTGFTTGVTVLTPAGLSVTGALVDSNNVANPDDLSVVINSTNLALTTIPGLVLTPNQTSVANYVDSNIVSGPLFNAFINILGSNPTLVAALDELSPEKSAHFFSDNAFNNASFSIQELTGYLNGLHTPQGDFLPATGSIDSSGFTALDPSMDPGLALTRGRLLAWDPAPVENGLLSDIPHTMFAGVDSKDIAKDMTPVVESRYPWNVFVLGNATLAQGFSQADLAHSDATTGSVQVGANFRVTPHLRVGALFGYGHTDADLDNNGSKATADTFSPGVYASYANEGWYGNAIASYGFDSFTEDRVVSFGGLSGTAHGSPNGNQVVADLDGGYDFHSGNWTYGPISGLQYTHLDVDSFSESGLAPADLNVNEDSSDSLRSRFGGHFSYTFKTDSVLLTPHMDASWQHEFMDQSRGVTSQFSSVGAGSFTVNTPSPSRDSALIDCGLTVDVDRRISVFTDYLMQAGQSNYFGQSVQAGMKIGF
jgi:fibronectin-binding autotransporter adhesin